MEKKTAAKKTTAKKPAEATKAKAKRETAAHAKGHEETHAAPKAAKAPKKAAPKHAHSKACKVGGCKRVYRAKGYCGNHYRQWRHGKFAKARYKRCHDYGCIKPMGLNRHGYCEEHFTNFYIKGMDVTHAPAAPVAAPKKEEKAADTAA